MEQEQEDEVDVPYYIQLQKVIDGDEQKWDDDEIKEILESIESLKQSFNEYCEHF